MQIIGKGLSREEFDQYVNSYDFGSIPPSSIILHHTFRPTKKEWNGYQSILGLKKYYEGLGWSAGPHCFVGEDKIWLFTPMNTVGIHAGEGNATWLNALGKEVKGYAKPWMGKLKSCSLGIEVVGNYDSEKWSGETLKNAVSTIKTLMEKLNLSTEDIYFHRDFPSAKKSCPGWAITKEWLGEQLFPKPKPVCNHSCTVHCSK